MPDKYDPYRERLVMETDTQWPDDCGSLSEAERTRLALQLHEHPAKATQLEYVRTHTGFCRRIIVTPGDLESWTKS